MNICASQTLEHQPIAGVVEAGAAPALLVSFSFFNFSAYIVLTALKFYYKCCLTQSFRK